MSYIIARIGGWKDYRSTTLPGPITFIRGLEEFDTQYAGYNLLGRNLGIKISSWYIGSESVRIESRKIYF